MSLDTRIKRLRALVPECIIRYEEAQGDRLARFTYGDRALVFWSDSGLQGFLSEPDTADQAFARSMFTSDTSYMIFLAKRLCGTYCSICGSVFYGEGHNPAPTLPTEEGNCCDRCNALVVVPERLGWV